MRSHLQMSPVTKSNSRDNLSINTDEIRDNDRISKPLHDGDDPPNDFLAEIEIAETNRRNDQKQIDVPETKSLLPPLPYDQPPSLTSSPILQISNSPKFCSFNNSDFDAYAFEQPEFTNAQLLSSPLIPQRRKMSNSRPSLLSTPTPESFRRQSDTPNSYDLEMKLMASGSTSTSAHYNNNLHGNNIYNGSVNNTALSTPKKFKEDEDDEFLNYSPVLTIDDKFEAISDIPLTEINLPRSTEDRIKFYEKLQKKEHDEFDKTLDSLKKSGWVSDRDIMQLESSKNESFHKWEAKILILKRSLRIKNKPSARSLSSTSTNSQVSVLNQAPAAIFPYNHHNSVHTNNNIHPNPVSVNSAIHHTPVPVNNGIYHTSIPVNNSVHYINNISNNNNNNNTPVIYHNHKSMNANTTSTINPVSVEVKPTRFRKKLNLNTNIVSYNVTPPSSGTGSYNTNLSVPCEYSNKKYQDSLRSPILEGSIHRSPFESSVQRSPIFENSLHYYRKGSYPGYYDLRSPTAASTAASSSAGTGAGTGTGTSASAALMTGTGAGTGTGTGASVKWWAKSQP